MGKYHKRIQVEGSDAFELAVNITGKGAPTEDTEAEPGMVYMDEESANGDLYKCISCTETKEKVVYTWKKMPSQEEVDKLSKAIDDLQKGGGTVVSAVEPADDDIPKVFFSGNTSGMTKDNEKVLAFSYKSKTADFDGFVKMKWQGSSSLNFPKKNFTIKMFSDESCGTKLKKTFKDWGHDGNKYVLKANYIDHTHARNIVTANLWSEMVANRPDYDTLPEELRNTPRNGAVDGFPVKLYLNGKYEGIYTWNIGKDDWMFGMDEDNPNHAVLCAEKNNNGNASTTDQNILSCEFRANAKIDGNDWSLEVPDTLHANIKTSFNALIDCVKNTNDATFKATIGNYLDITSALDYYILVYFSAAVDNTAKNLLMITYDGTKWYCSAYDLDNIWGARGTNTFVSADFQCPEGYQDTNSLLWQRIEKCFGAELYARYLEIREKVLSFPNVIDKFERFCDLIGTELYAEDVEIYSGIPYPNDNNLKQIRNYIAPRAEYVDDCMHAIANGENDSGGEGGEGGGGTEEPPVTTNTYSMSEPTTFASISDMVDTGVALWSSDHDFTVALDMTPEVPTAESCVFAVNYESSPYSGINLSVRPNQNYILRCFGSNLDSVDTGFAYNNTGNIKMVLTHQAGTSEYVLTVNGGEKTTITNDFGVSHSNHLYIGAADGWSTPARPWKGTMNKFEILDRVMSDSEIEEFVAIEENLYELSEPTTFTSTADMVNTGVEPFVGGQNWTIALDMTPEAQSSETCVFVARSILKFACHPTAFGTSNVYGFMSNNNSTKTATTIPMNTTTRTKVVISRASDSEYATAYYNVDGVKQTVEFIVGTGPAVLYIGADDGWSTPVRSWKGTMNKFEIYAKVFTDDEVDAFLNG